MTTITRPSIDQAPHQVPQPTDPLPLAGQRVLVVEDEMVLALDIEEGLEGAGATVVGPVPSLADAGLLLALARRLDAAVLDVNLGGETVYPLADALVAAGIPIVFASGYSETELPARFVGVSHLEKPVDVGALTLAVSRSISRNAVPEASDWNHPEP